MAVRLLQFVTKLHCGINTKLPSPAWHSLRTYTQDINKIPQKDHGKENKQKLSSGDTYAVPEYYEHDEYSFLDIQIAMNQHRIPQPSSKSSESSK